MTKVRSARITMAGSPEGVVAATSDCVGPGAAYCAAYDEIDYLDEVLTFFDDHPMP